MSLLLLVSCLFTFTGSLSCTSDVLLEQHVALFVFGDSGFDPGNNDYINTTYEFQSNYWPYGVSYFNPPSGRFSNGRLIPDFIAEYARLPLIPAYLNPRNNEFVYGANFASGGAGALVETNAGLVVDLKTQLQRFGDLEKHFRRNLGDFKTEQILSNAVYMVNCGSNDYFSLIGTYTHEESVDMVTGNLTHMFKGIYEKGGRKIGIMNLPLLGCWPSVRAGREGNTCDKELDVISRLHNQQLSNKLQELEKQLQGFKYAMFDILTAISNRMNNPSKFGFKVVDSACCGSGPFGGIYSCGGKRGIKEFELCDNVDEYLFFDSNHLTEVAYRQTAELFWNGDSNVTSPYSLKALFQVEGTKHPNRHLTFYRSVYIFMVGFWFWFWFWFLLVTQENNPRSKKYETSKLCCDKHVYRFE